MIKRYPDSPYTPIAEKARLEAQRLVVDHENYVRRFYESQEQYAAAQSRRKSYQEERKEYVAQARSLQQSEQSRITTTTDTLPQPRLVLALRSKDKKLGQTSDNSLRAMLTDFEMAEKLENKVLSIPKGLTTIERVSCSRDNGKSLIAITLSNTIADPHFARQNLSLQGSNGVLSLQVPQAVSEPRTFDCLTKGDLMVTSNGLITIRGISEAELLEVNYPPRLLISAR
jgi:hypothetical protein